MVLSVQLKVSLKKLLISIKEKITNRQSTENRLIANKHMKKHTLQHVNKIFKLKD